MDEVTFLEYLSYPFVRNALVAGVLISLCAALLGVPLVLRRLSFMGDGLSHVAFGAMAVAGVLNFADTMALSLPVTIAAALVLMRSGRGAKTGGDAMLAMLSVGAMAAGYLVMNLSRPRPTSPATSAPRCSARSRFSPSPPSTCGSRSDCPLPCASCGSSPTTACST